MGSRPRFRSPCVTAPAHLLPYAPLYPLLPVLTRCAASYPPGLAALCRVPAVLRGLRLARSPLAIASRRPRSSPNPGYRLPARSAAPFLPAPAHLLPCGVAAYYLPPTLSPSAGWGGALGAAERAGRRNPRFGAARRHRDALAGRWGARRVDRGEESRPSPLGRAAERARSAARASPGHPLRMALSPPRPIFFLIFNRCTPLKNANIFLCLKTYLTLIKTGGGVVSITFSLNLLHNI